jgi:hypothetical protein
MATFTPWTSSGPSLPSCTRSLHRDPINATCDQYRKLTFAA